MKYLKILLISILTLSICITVNAEVTTQDRTTLENYGVNKKWKITEENKGKILNTPKVDASEKIYDFENVLTEEEKIELKKQIDEYMEKTGFELVIVIKNLPYYSDSENEDYAADFYDYNDFGLELNKYGGTLLLRNTYEQDPYYDFYMFGETQLYYQGNHRNDDILDSIYNELSSKDYYNGFSHYISLLDSYYNQGKTSDLNGYSIDENGYLQRPKYSVPYVFVFLFSLILTLITISIMISKNKMIHKALEAREYVDNASTKYTNRSDHLITTHTTHHIITSSSSSGGGGFHSSGGSSGGGHSSGGGRHG